MQRLDVEVQVACCADRCKERLVVKMLVAAMMVSATAAFAAVDWDNAMIKGKTEDGRLFYGPGETITMNLWLEGVDAELPPPSTDSAASSSVPRGMSLRFTPDDRIMAVMPASGA